MTNTSIKTKFGNANLSKRGYYIITSGKEGNHLKFLHRLIFEDFYNINLDVEFPEGVIIHHEDGNKLNNNIWNLVPMTPDEHMSLHKKGNIVSDKIKKKLSIANSGENNGMYGKKHSSNTKITMSKIKNKTGYFRVFKSKNKQYKQGYGYIYSFYDEGVQKRVYAKTIDKLKAKVIEKGWEWRELFD